MEDLFATLFNIAFYIFIFKLISGAASGKKKKKETSDKSPVIVEKTKENKKKKSFFEEALEQLKKLEELSKEPVTKKKKFKQVPPMPVPEIKPEPVARIKKVIDEKSQEIYYNNEESEYSLEKIDLKKAIVYSEIIGKPVSRRIGMPYRR
ncbi:MAG: hypothetical protein EOM04_01530 [Clostridia bacterium]|nr:hypothetical protein [Clostridia bacterium]